MPDATAASTPGSNVFATPFDAAAAEAAEVAAAAVREVASAVGVPVEVTKSAFAAARSCGRAGDSASRLIRVVDEGSERGQRQNRPQEAQGEGGPCPLSAQSRGCAGACT